MDATVKYEFQLLDHISAPLKQIQAAMRQTEAAVAGLKNQLKSMGVDLKETSKATGGLARSTSNLQDKVATLKTGMNRLGASMITGTLNANNFKSALSGVAGVNNQVADTAGRAHGHVMSLGSAFHSIAAGIYVAQHALEGFEAAMQPAIQLQHQQLKMRMLHMTDADQRSVNKMAFQISQRVPTSTQADVLRSVSDIYGINKEFAKSGMVMRSVERLKANIAASSPSGEMDSATLERFAQSAIKVAEIRGQTQNVGQVRHNLDLLNNIGVASGGRVTPDLIANIVKLIGPSVKSYDDNMFYYLGHIAQELSTGKGGGSRGIAPMLNQLNRVLINGVMDKGTLASLQRLQLLPQYVGKINTTTIKTQIAPQLKDRELAIRDMQQWVQRDLRPALRRTFGPLKNMPLAKQVSMLQKTFPGLNVTSARGLSEMLMTSNQRQFENFKGIAEKVGGVDQQYLLTMQDVGVRTEALRKSLEQLGATMLSDKQIMGGTAAGLDSITRSIKHMTLAMQTYPVSDRLNDLAGQYPHLMSFVNGIGDVFKTISESIGRILGTAAEGWLKIFDVLGHGVDYIKNPTGTFAQDWGEFKQNFERGKQNTAGFVPPPGWKTSSDGNSSMRVSPPPVAQPWPDDPYMQAAKAASDARWQAPKHHNYGGAEPIHPHSAPVIHIEHLQVQANNAHEFTEDIWRQAASIMHQHGETFTYANPARQSSANTGKQ